MSNKIDKLSKLGLGCVTFGREIDKKTSFDLMDYAYSNGITFFDTAAAYGGGASEEIVGDWMRERRISTDKVVIGTKIMPPYGSEHVRLSVKKSLKRLQIKTVDVLYLHRWDDILRTPEPWLALEALRTEGKIIELGVSNFNAAQLSDALKVQRAAGLSPLSFIQNNHNLAVSDVSDKIRMTCKENNIRIVAFSPLGAGFLTGKHTGGIQEGSRFSAIPAHQDIYFNEHSQKRLEKLLHVAERTGNSPVHLALSWAIHQADICTVLVGGRTITHLNQAIEAANLHDEELLRELYYSK